MTIITDVYAREVLDSRGNPTVEVEVYPGVRRQSAAQSFHPALPLAHTKLLSFVTATKAVTWVKAFCKRLKT